MLAETGPPPSSASGEGKGGGGDGDGISPVDNTSYTNYKYHDSDGGDGGGDKVIAAGQSTWESAQTYLVDELRTLVRARDMALAEQRVRHVRESVVIREQQHALAKGHKVGEKLAKLFGWVGFAASRSDSLFSTPIAPLVAIGGTIDVCEGGSVSGAAPTGVGTCSNEAELLAESQSRNNNHEALASTCKLPEEHELDEASSGESQTRLSAVEAMGTPINSDQRAACACCLELRRKLQELRRRLQVAVTDRCLAEAELVSIRRATTLKYDFDTDGGRDRCIRDTTATGVPRGNDNGQPRQKLSSALAKNENKANLGLRDELIRMEEANKALLAEDIVRPLVTETPCSGVALRGSAVKSAEGSPNEVMAHQPVSDAAGSEAVNFAVSLSATVEKSARHFEELARQRLLRMGLEVDLRAARAKLDDLIRGTSPAAHPTAETTDVQNGIATSGPFKTGGAIQEVVSANDIGQPSQKNATDTGRKSPGRGFNPKSGSRGRSVRGRGIDSRQRGRGAVSGHGSPPVDTPPSPRRLSSSVKTHAPHKAPPGTHDGQFANREFERSATTRATSERTGKAQVGNVRRRPYATAVLEKKLQKRRARAGEMDNVITGDGSVDTTPEGAEENIPEQGPLSCVDDIGWGPKTGKRPGLDIGKRPTEPSSASTVDGPLATATNTAAMKPDVAARVDAQNPETSPPPPDINFEETEGKANAHEDAGGLATDGDCFVASVDEQHCPSVATSPEHIGKKKVPAKIPVAKRQTSRKTAGSSPRVDKTLSPRDSPRKLAKKTPLEPPSRALNSLQRKVADGDDQLLLSAKDSPECTADEATSAPADVGQMEPIKAALDVVRCESTCLGNYSTDNPTGKATTDTEGSPVARPVGVEGRGGIGHATTRGRAKGTKAAQSRIAISTQGAKLGKDAGETAPSRPPRKAASKASARDDMGDPRIAANAQHVSMAGTSDGEYDAEITLSHPVDDGTPHELGVVDGTIDGGRPRALGEAQVPGTARRNSHNSASNNISVRCAGEELDEEVHSSKQLPVTYDENAATRVAQEDDRPAGGGSEGSKGVSGQTKPAIDMSGGGEVKQLTGHDTGEGCLLGGVDQLDSLRIEVEKLRLERAELEDTIAQLNVAAAQLFLVEYVQMKGNCRQLQRVVMGPAARPTDEASSCGNSCQEVLHRLKMIGAKYFRRRIGGNVGNTFFPDGLSRALTLVGRPRVSQGCQAGPVSFNILGQEADASSRPEMKDVHVQVAGGIDADDEPLMEQQVYALLGKLDLVLKRREDVLSSYHREAEEGAREARALLAAAAAQHKPGQAWGVSRVPNVRELVAGREGPAGAPRPALNPTNLLFTAAVVLDSITTATPTARQAISTTNGATGSDEGAAKNGGGSRLHRYSPAETALLELSHEVVAALESEQRRSDVSAERRRFASEKGEATALARPPAGVPPLIWDMGIHLVGKLASAFRTTVEARGFEREVADADLVAAVSLGRSSSTGADKSQGSPWHLEHRMMSAVQDVEQCGEQQAHGKKQDAGVEREDFDWASGSYAQFRSDRPKNSTAAGVGGGIVGGIVCRADDRSKRRSPLPPSKMADDCAREQYGRRATDSPAGRDGYGVFPARTTSVGAPSHPRVAHRHRGGPGARRKPQPRHASAADALVEAATFDTVRPSLLHPRPASASFEGRNRFDRSEQEAYTLGVARGFNGPRERGEYDRPRPQSARRAEPRGFSEGGGNGGAGVNGSMHGVPAQSQGWMHEENNAAAARQPIRPSKAVRPASAGARVVDTRVWSSSVVKPGVFRCRPPKPRGSVRFESTAGSSPPTHAGEVPGFLARKERELAEREKTAAVTGRFESQQIHNEHYDGTPTVELEPRWEEGALLGAGGHGGSTLSSRRLEESMDGEGLLPDAGEQAFFEAWKPAGYGYDLSRYD